MISIQVVIFDLDGTLHNNPAYDFCRFNAEIRVIAKILGITEKQAMQKYLEFYILYCIIGTYKTPILLGETSS